MRIFNSKSQVLKLIAFSTMLLSSTMMTAQCMVEVTLEYISINFASGCDFGDSQGMDPTILMTDAEGNIVLFTEITDMGQVNGPMQNVPIDPVINPDCCGNGYVVPIGTFPLGTEEFIYHIELYEKDGGCCQPYEPPGPFGLIGDEDYAEGDHTFDITMPQGTVDVGSCISFNYNLILDTIGSVINSITGPFCYDHVEIVNGVAHSIDNPIGQYPADVPSVLGCDSTISVFMNFFPEPFITFDDTTPYCPGESTTVSIIEDFQTYEWSTGDTGKSIDVSSPDPISVTITDVNGCQKEEMLQIAPHIVDDAMILGDAQFCEGITNTISVDPIFDAYLWEDGSTAASIDINTPGDYSVIVTDGNGCTSSSSASFSNFDVPDLSITGILSVCEGGSTTLGTTVGFDSYLWSNGETSPMASYTLVGMHNVELIDNFGCEYTIPFEITALTVPSPEISGALEFCFGSSVKLSTINDYTTYDWMDSNGQSLSTDFTIELDQEGSYSLMVTDAQGCVAQTDFAISEASIITIDIDILTCDPNLVGSETIEYQDADGCTVSETSNTILNPDMSACLLDLSGISIQVIDETCGSFNGSFTVDQNFDFEVPYRIENEDGVVIQNGTTSNDGTTFGVALSSAGTFLVIFTADNGMEQVVPIVINNSSEISYDIENNYTITEGTILDLSINVDEDMISNITWSANGELLCQDCFSLQYTASSTTDIEVDFTDISGCSTTEIISIILEEENIIEEPTDTLGYYVPNIMDLNDFGENGSFFVAGDILSIETTYEVFDRWGNLMYFAPNKDARWDGTFMGEEVRSGVYVICLNLRFQDGSGKVECHDLTVIN